ncbi:MAG: alcohol dehydrogenase catalytic domain-containing protein [Planctomycetes bacterium]|nr:alcohol dehydrogenase catalytic domain-containing protein [Planctomycetota bacterium]
MDAVRLTEPGRLERFTPAEPAPPQVGEALVAVKRVGVCGTDLHAFAGRQPFFTYPRVLGHELAVEVLDCPSGAIARGARCTVVPYLPCGACLACRRSRPNCCAEVRVLGVHVDGGMRERFVLPDAALVPCDDLDLDALALVETLAIGAHAVARAAPDPARDVAAVVGAGPIGLGVAARLRALGVPVALLDRSETRIAAARDRAGFDSVVVATGTDDAERLRAACGGELPTVLFDATGAPASMNRALELVAPTATIVFVGLHREAVTFPDIDFHRKELSLLASRNATHAEFRTVIDDLHHGRVEAPTFVTHRTDLASIGTDLPAFADPARGVIKAMLDIGAP